MHPVFLSFGTFAIRWYGVCAALGFLVAAYLLRKNCAIARLTRDQSLNVIMLTMLTGVIGARIFYVIQNWNYYARHLSGIIRIDQGGLVFYGGFILATLSLIWYAKYRCHADCIRVCDVMTPALAAAHALGRIGCFLNGCCYGKPAEYFWCVAYPEGSAPFLRYGGATLHPVQLYEAAFNVLLAIFLFYLVRKTKRGVAMATYILAYGILRFLDEFLRGDHTQFAAGFTPAQIIGFGLIPIGIALLIWFATRKSAPEMDKNK